MPDESIWGDEGPPQHPQRRPGPNDQPPSKEELHRRVDALAEETMRSTGKPPSPESVQQAHDIIEGKPTAKLIRATDLLDPEDLDTGDFEPGGRYKGFAILPKHLWPADEWTPRHEARWGDQRFYVTTDSGTVGLVPWEGSQIVWPWDRAWTVDLWRPEVTSFLKEEKEGKKK